MELLQEGAASQQSASQPARLHTICSLNQTGGFQETKRAAKQSWVNFRGTCYKLLSSGGISCVVPLSSQADDFVTLRGQARKEKLWATCTHCFLFFFCFFIISVGHQLVVWPDVLDILFLWGAHFRPPVDFMCHLIISPCSRAHTQTGACSSSESKTGLCVNSRAQMQNTCADIRRFYIIDI